MYMFSIFHVPNYILLFKHLCFHVRNNTSQICVNSEVIVCGTSIWFLEIQLYLLLHGFQLMIVMESDCAHGFVHVFPAFRSHTEKTAMGPVCYRHSSCFEMHD